MKRELRALLVERNLDEIVDRAGRRKRVLGTLVALTFDRDPEIGWRAVQAMGLAAARIADHDPTAVREHLRRLLWLISEESGGICWHAPQALAEIVYHRPALFADYIPIIIHLLLEMAEEDLAHFRAGLLWAVGRLGELARPHIQDVLPDLVAALRDPDPQVRGMAVWALHELGRNDLLDQRPHLREDEGPVQLFENGVLRRTSVAGLMQRAPPTR